MNYFIINEERQWYLLFRIGRHRAPLLTLTTSDRKYEECRSTLYLSSLPLLSLPLRAAKLLEIMADDTREEKVTKKRQKERPPSSGEGRIGKEAERYTCRV